MIKGKAEVPVRVEDAFGRNPYRGSGKKQGKLGRKAMEYYFKRTSAAPPRAAGSGPGADFPKALEGLFPKNKIHMKLLKDFGNIGS